MESGAEVLLPRWLSLAPARSVATAGTRAAAAARPARDGYCRVFASLPTTAEQLDGSARVRGISLRRWLGLDASQVSRWRGFDPRIIPTRPSTKPVPRDHVLAIAERLGPEGPLLEMLHDIEDQVHRMARRAHESRMFAACWTDVLALLQDLVAKEEPLGLAERAARCRRYLIIARQVLADFEHTAFDEPEAPPVPPETIELSLRYPAHLVAGRVLASPSLAAMMPLSDRSARDIVVHGLRRQARATGPQAHDQNYCRLHATHLLLRFGEEGDLDAAPCIPSDDAGFDHPIERSMMASARLLAPRSKAPDDDFAQQLVRDDSLCEASLAFDALHYGDASRGLRSVALPDSYDRSLWHLAGRVDSIGLDSPYASVAAVKLARILRLTSSKPRASFHPLAATDAALAGFVERYVADRGIRNELFSAARSAGLI